MVAIRSSAPKYMIRNKDGHFLHGSTTGFVEDTTYAWIGTATQHANLVKQKPKLNQCELVALINHTRNIATI